MTDIASLGIRIDTGDVARARDELGRFTKAGTATEAAAKRLAAANGQVRDEFNRFSKSSSAAEGATRRFTSAQQDLATSMRRVQQLVSGAALAYIARQTLLAADAYNNLNARLLLVTSSTKEFNEAQARVFQIAQATRVGLGQTSDLFGSLTRSTEALGVSQAEVLGVTKTINQALQVSGTSAQSAAAALVQLGQGFASGTLRGEELNSVLEQAPRLAHAIADGLGVPIGSLRKLGEEGQLTAERVFGALQRTAGQIESEFQRLPLTVGGATTQAQNSLLRLVGTIDDVTGSTEGLASSISSASGFVAELADEIRRAASGQRDVGFLAEAFLTVSETIQIVFANVSFVFKAIGREIGAIAAQLVALSKLDLNGFSAISDAVKEDAQRARAELDALEKRILGRNFVPEVGQSDRRELARRGRAVEPFGIAVEDPLTVNGKKGRAQAKPDVLGFDVAKIRAELERLTSAYSAAESILEAQRSAGLLSEREYYQAKAGFIRLNEDAQVRALEAENARLANEKGNAKERLAAQEKIAANEAKIASIKADAAAKGTVLDIQQASAMKALEQSYRDAEAAAQSYLDTLRRSQNLDLAGFGVGSQERARMQARAQIEDRFEQQRQDLQRGRRDAELNGTFNADAQARYDDELARIKRFQSAALREFDAYYAARMEKERSFTVGATEAMQNYIDEASNVAKLTEDFFTRTFQSMEDAIVEFVQTGKLDFKSLADSIIADITRIIVKQQIANLMQSAMSSAGGEGGGFWSTAASAVAGLFGGGRATGGPVSAGRLYEINERGGPGEILSAGGKQYLMPTQDGSVKPTKSGGENRPTVIQVQVSAQPGMSKDTAMQQGAQIGQGIQRALARNG